MKAQKLCDRIIQTHSNEGDTIFIPFVGSISEIISVIKNNRKAFGCEIYNLAKDIINTLLKVDRYY